MSGPVPPGTSRTRPLVLAPLRIEALAIGGDVERVGMGRAKAISAGQRLAGSTAPGRPVVLAGMGGALGGAVRPGHVVVATEVRDVDGTVQRPLDGAELLAAEFARLGCPVVTGPIVSSPRFVHGEERRRLTAGGVVAFDMESAWIADALADHPMAVVRVVSDTAECNILSGGVRALASLRRVRLPIERWAGATGLSEIRLAAPRSFCAGVVRAIDIVDAAIQRFGAPVYVRRQIVHNRHVIDDLERRGAVFVSELTEVPAGATVVFAAHGVSPAVRAEAARRPDLRVIDATCPLVAKVHHEVRRFAQLGHQIVVVGHADHEEVEGTVGEAPDLIQVVERVEQVDDLELDADAPVAYLTQTTLATDETAVVVERLRERFPQIAGPHVDDICYATQNRQDALRKLATRCEVVLVIGSANSSNTARLVEVAERAGCRAHLVEDMAHVELGWLEGVRSLGITAGASAPPDLVDEVVAALGALSGATVFEDVTAEETVHFALPPQVRP
ncbi:MAG: 4-hydroxy-3-methylbut-2-enyl diphosphate reductase [Actinomycetota bacterium]|nr:4-hydroxy-3-methylbut-2-enyl diphosphate reductase [Actinomycetota bacterium]